ncbi:hypothetical protein PybrP1_002429 [[Pythium] brassicae (nom. inval.)]|nr:hypothetical protein PybrP1_002429 [[Pythium] brassicae (nom. inval.)]
MNALFRRERARSTSAVDAELDSWLCDAHSHRSQRLSAAAALAAPPIEQPHASHPEAGPSTPPTTNTITYFWDRRNGLPLEVGRGGASGDPSTSAQRPRWTVVYWQPSSETLGITVDVETTTRQVIVTRSARRDIRAGAVVMRIAGHEAREDNFRKLLRAGKLSPGITLSLELAPAPAPVVVTKPSYELALLGIHADAFELLAVDGCYVRYLSLPAIDRLIRGDSAASRICKMVFQRTQEAKRGWQQGRSGHTGSSHSGVAAALAGVAVLSSALS